VGGQQYIRSLKGDSVRSFSECCVMSRAVGRGYTILSDYRLCGVPVLFSFFVFFSFLLSFLTFFSFSFLFLFLPPLSNIFFILSVAHLPLTRFLRVVFQFSSVFMEGFFSHLFVAIFWCFFCSAYCTSNLFTRKQGSFRSGTSQVHLQVPVLQNTT